MEVAGGDVVEHYFSGSSPYWSPVTEWLPVSAENDFEYISRDMVWHSDMYALAGTSSETLDKWSSSTVSQSTFSSAAATPAEEPTKSTFFDVVGKEKELRLVHLLSAAAEAIAGDKKSRELSRVILARLKDLLPSPAVTGSGVERLAAHFTDGLCRLVDGDSRLKDVTATVTAASQLFQDMSPYVNFGHFTANQAILEEVGGERRVHIVDLSIVDGAQWAPLLQAFVGNNGRPPPSHVKITAVVAGRKAAVLEVVETGRRLAAFAASVGLPFSFAQCRLHKDGYFRPSAVKVLRGEGLVFNCALHAPHGHRHDTTTVKSFLAGAAVVGARLVTVVEEGGGRSPVKEGFLGRFLDEMQRYSAVWDALEAGFAKQVRAREMVESVVLGPAIAGALEMAYRRGEERRGEGWEGWMAAAGFGRVGLSFFNQWQAKLLIGLFNDGYCVEEDERNKLVLGWKTRRLVAVSVWSVPPSAKVEG